MPLTPGTRLGSYQIGVPLGRGGVGEVYRAWDPRLEREVALKILRERSELDPDRVWRFVAEARAASALNHPNILTVFDAAVDGDTPYIVSELIEGDSLRGEVRRGAVPLKRLLDLATQIADGLAEAHAAGIVHRDLKPENIMVTPGGRAKILDFGLARTTGFQSSGAVPVHVDGQTQTESGLLVGTIPYMSPEQARGAGSDFRSDQFSFGLILYEMAAGMSAFRRDTPAQTLEAIISDEPTPLPDVNAQIPPLLWWIIERCLAKNPGDRYGSSADLHRDLRNLRDRLGETVARERRQRAAAPARARSRRVLVPAAILAALLTGAAIWALTFGAREDSSILGFTPFATDAAYEGLPAWSPDGQTIAYAAEVNGVLQIFTRTLTSASPAQVTEAPFDCKYPFWSRDGKRIYYVSLAKTRDGIWSVGAAGGSPQIVVENATRGAVSPDGRTLAFIRDEQRADIVGTGAVYLATPPRPEPWSNNVVEAAAKRYEGFGDMRFVEGVLAFSPDGRSLGICAVPFRGLPFNRAEEYQLGWQFWVVALPEGRLTRHLAWWTEPIPRVSSFTWLPDSRHVVLGVNALSTPGSHLWMMDRERDRVWPLTRSADSESYPSASPNGEQIVFTKGEPDYDLVELSITGRPMQPVLSTARKETDPVWSPDGHLMAYVTDRSGWDEIWVRNTTGPPFERPLITRRDFVEDQNILLAAPTFSPNGQRVAYLRTGRRPIVPLQIFTSSTAGGPPVRLLPESHESYQGAPTWSPDGQWIAFAEWRGKRWELVKMRFGSGEPPIALRTDGVPNAAPQWSPKNDWITWEIEEGFVLVSPDGRQARKLEIDQWLVHAWSPDGSAILGITESDDLRLSLVSVDVQTVRQRVLADLGPSPPANNPIQGFSVNPDGRRILSSSVQLRGDLWLLKTVRPPETLRRRLFPMQTP